MLPRSPLATAITYAKNQWTALNTYVTQGFLNIDNNASERALKRVALGRKNWLFAGHDAAAQNHARLWSLIASAERHAIDPQRYLTSVLARIGATPAAELEDFLPDNWKRADADEPPPASNPNYRNCEPRNGHEANARDYCRDQIIPPWTTERTHFTWEN